MEGAQGLPARVLAVGIDISRDGLARFDALAKLDAMDHAVALVEFDMDGQVLAANENYLKLMGYTLAEVVGRPHTLFCDAETAASDSYRDLWNALKRDQICHGAYKRVGKNEADVWLRAFYTPIAAPTANCSACSRSPTISPSSALPPPNTRPSWKRSTAPWRWWSSIWTAT
jgi:methyl-accepting chemotaxis protein